jgi:hypothetical protein
MTKLIGALFKLVLILAFGGFIFVGLMFWAKFWGIYSIPPSKEKPDGATWVVTREEDEPLMNAPDRPVKYPTEGLEEEEKPKRLKGIYEGEPVPKKPIEKRIIAKLPYINYFHEKALENPIIKKSLPPL